MIDYSQVYVSSPYIKNLDSWKDLGANVSTDNSLVVKESDVVFLAVKPHVFCDAVKQIEKGANMKYTKNKLFISILAGVTTTNVEKVGKYILYSKHGKRWSKGQSVCPIRHEFYFHRARGFYWFVFSICFQKCIPICLTIIV